MVIGATAALQTTGDQSSGQGPEYDGAKEVEEFEKTKAGVKGLVDSGIVSVPKLFLQPVEKLTEEPTQELPDESWDGSGRVTIPVIDLAGLEVEVADRALRASTTWGFFQVVNHGIPLVVMEGMLDGTKRFHEQPMEAKQAWYTRDTKKLVRFYTNGDLLISKVGSWRDSISFDYRDSVLNSDEIPLVFREEVQEYMEHILELRERLCRILSTALGLDKDSLSSIGCMKTATLVSHYYPTCPEPDLTLGAKKHSDPSFLTILLQDSIGGLQILHQGHWVDVIPTQGALLINIGDLMQLITNDKFRSVEHRVLVGRTTPRVSTACFFYPSTENKSKPYGPLKELVSDQNPPLYREISTKEYLAYYRSQGLGGTQAIPHFKL
ncbi:hypothetical protein Droror1_Dr00008343 [Drosera rotundifolia]